jgi:hypothetical protein
VGLLLIPPAHILAPPVTFRYVACRYRPIVIPHVQQLLEVPALTVTVVVGGGGATLTTVVGAATSWLELEAAVVDAVVGAAVDVEEEEMYAEGQQ